MPTVEEYLAGLNASILALKDALAKGFPSEDARDDARRRAIERRLSAAVSDYDVKTIALDTAATNQEYTLVGEGLSAWTDGTPNGITIRLNTVQSPAIPLQAFRSPRGLFGKIYVTWTAQAGRSLYLYIGRNAASILDAPMMEQYPLNLLVRQDSTTTPLADGATYTGAQFWVANYGWIVGTCLANRAGTLYVDQSNDGTNYDSVTSFAYTASDTMGFKVTVVGTYARIRFTNSAGAVQTTFRLYANTRSM